MSARALSDENWALRSLLREAAATHPRPSAQLAKWWQGEQDRMRAEQAEENKRKAERRTELEREISRLQAELGRL